MQSMLNSQTAIYYDKALDKLHENINQQITAIESSQKQLESQLQEIDTDQLFCQTSVFTLELINYQQMQSAIQSGLERIQNQEQINQCLSILSSIDNSIIDLIPKVKGIENEQKKHSKLDFLCPEHNEEIRLFDLTEQSEKQNRLPCDQCLSEKLGTYTPLSVVQNRWQEYELTYKKQLLTSQEKCKKLLGFVEEQLKLLLHSFSEKIGEAIGELKKSELIFEKQNEPILNKMGRDWQILSKEDVLEVAEILSKPSFYDNMQSLTEEKYKQHCEDVNKLISVSLLTLQQIQKQCLGKIEQTLELNQNLKTIDDYLISTDLIKNDSMSQTIRKLNYNQSIISIDFYKQIERKQAECQWDLMLQSCQLITSVSYCQIKPIQQTIKCQESKEILQNTGPINDQLIKQVENPASSWCGGIALNKQQTILVAGCDKTIKVFEFREGQLKLLQQLTDHTNYVYSLYFMNKFNQFVSGSNEGTLRVWSQNNNQQWYCQQVLQNPPSNGYCVILNLNEDIIISGGQDHSIKFWVKQTEWICSQSLAGHTSTVNYLSLNESQNQLVSCGQDSQILISQIDNNKNWAVIQTIKVVTCGYRICFIGDICVTFQPNMAAKMDIFELNQQTRQFIKSKEIKVEVSGREYQGFPQRFNRKKQILLNKNGFILNLLRKRGDGDLVVEQIIDFGHQYMEGTISDDGEYIITHHNYDSFQVRKYQ